jgi:hypothetical protein
MIAAAVRIARYLMPHAEAVPAVMSARDDSGEDDARYLLRWIERKFSKRDAHQHGKRRFPKADAMDAALGELTARGYIRPLPTEAPRPGRPASPRYEVNPAVCNIEANEGRSHNSHNGGDEGPEPSFGNIRSALSVPPAALATGLNGTPAAPGREAFTL